jgi:hypothetical protein
MINLRKFLSEEIDIFLKKNKLIFLLFPKLIHTSNEVIFNVGKEANKVFID